MLSYPHQERDGGDSDARHDCEARENVLGRGGGSRPRSDDAQAATLNSAPGKILYRFHARDVHLVLGPTKEGKPVHFRVRIDGKAPEDKHGVDTDTGGNGMVVEHRLYQLIRQKNAMDDHTFQIEFLDPGVQAFAFTFG